VSKPAERPVVALYTTADSWRGAGISFINIACGLEEHGYRAQLIVTSDEIAREFLRAGVGVVSVLPAERKLQAFRLRRRLSEVGASLVLVDRAHDLRVATRAVLGTGIGIIKRYNLFRQAPPNDLLTQLAYRDSVKEVVFLSHAQRERVLAEAPFMRGTRASTIHEGVDLDLFQPSTEAGVLFRKAYSITGAFLLAVGALTAEKRYDFIFDSLSLLGEEAPELLILGEGPDEKRLRARAEELKLRTIFLGRIPHGHTVGAYNASLGVVHACCVETFGLSVLEAMASGRPVVACSGGALPELIGTDGGAGTLVTPDSEVEFASAVRCLFTEPDEAHATGMRARERAMKFPLRSMQQEYARVVERSLRGGAV
jgi:glycosyltransferase involved in cell wall biosynthesis